MRKPRRDTSQPRRTTDRWAAMACLACALMAGCAPGALDRAPQAASEPWSPQEAGTPGQTGAPAPPPASARDFGIAANPEVTLPPAAPEIATNRAYDLAGLIDVAQRNNPATRIAWQSARQAALASGMVEATYLPLITANVIGGYQKFDNPLPVGLGGINQIETTTTGISPQIAVQWLIFDFGQRSAAHDSAKHTATAASILFNGLHQKIIHDVTRAYFVHDAARSRVEIAEQTLRNSRDILAAAEARVKDGLGNTVEEAQARQQVAQAQFGLVQAQGAERETYQMLLGAMGVSPLTKMRVKAANGRALPANIGAPTERMLQAALARRPDVLASLSAMKASRSGIAAAQAEFLPKVYLGAIAAGGNSSLSAANLPNIAQISSASGVVIGASVPIFDGGLRAAQLKTAESLAAASEATFTKVRDEAAREIVIATETLRSALASHQAATALVRAAQTTYDAAFSAYKMGVGNISVATEADSGLLAARQAEAESHAAALVAAANLAFVLGAMTSSDVASGLVRR
ncbi:TolC family protein [Aquabacter spiritensis]|uniref:Protein CyaE n=1 Tax=Aquabacter spiritensis TaxID=933073 RepID=A0A4V2UY27_9HYPH|nr:TolC family protein [Aquabacter spiritensis]TCT05698.1 outer membrane protein TolC [Aquabacter spiritensis]